MNIEMMNEFIFLGLYLDLTVRYVSTKLKVEQLTIRNQIVDHQSFIIEHSPDDGLEYQFFMEQSKLLGIKSNIDWIVSLLNIQIQIWNSGILMTAIFGTEK